MTSIDYSAAKFWLDIAHWLALIAIGVWTYLRTRDNENASAVKAVAVELADFIRASNLANQEQNQRLTVMEETVKHLPTAREQSELREEVASLAAGLEGMGTLLKRVEHQTQLIHQHLLSNK
ncbi:DUF2730 family protein [Rhodoferax sp.]|uniref:DUF2730 family protein n=1 Tax=Rhodoferax sp. TaxID=50421 RepID=UPI002ACE27FA|nr:DUF2730 family protein [Rhodoferax sp.]MDZ7920744.1 DUF2730 family protein [Rhodoferax sp.]